MTPIILITLILVWQAVLAGYTFTLAGNAADEAARAAAVAADAKGAAEAAAKSDLPDAWAGDAKTSSPEFENGQVEVTVTLHVPVLFPGVIDFPFQVHGHAKTVDDG